MEPMQVAYEHIRVTPNGVLVQELLAKSLEHELTDKLSNNICTISEMDSGSNSDKLLKHILVALKT